MHSANFHSGAPSPLATTPNPVPKKFLSLMLRLNAWKTKRKMVEAAVFHIVSAAGKALSGSEWGELVTDRRPLDNAIDDVRKSPTPEAAPPSSDTGTEKGDSQKGGPCGTFLSRSY